MIHECPTIEDKKVTDFVQKRRPVIYGSIGTYEIDSSEYKTKSLMTMYDINAKVFLDLQ